MTMLTRLLLAAVLLLSLLTPVRASEGVLTFGVFPFNSALTLVRTHQPLRDHLAEVLQRPVQLYSAPDYAGFIDELAAARFDFVIVPPHFAVFAHQRGYQPLATYANELEFVLILGPGVDEDLRGKRVGVPDRLTIASIAALRWLEERGLKAGVDYQLHDYSTHGAAAAAVALGDAAAAVVAASALRQTPADVRQGVRVSAVVGRFPSLVTMVHERFGPDMHVRSSAALMAFPDSERGRQFFGGTHYGGYRAADLSVLRDLEPYWEIARRLMAEQR
ncbi:hypothetical protein C8261_16535 [Pseudothauera lacus]|uniref:Uncharacterized protein n=2 Tax=Pseudothauera lacus TaxID=2136175 RepID=A0A2T4IBF1_9RHOO|nr:hypothetical protein C8261_16535 [Pseudothauera lacus]